jgi:hypothetical protein
LFLDHFPLAQFAVTQDIPVIHMRDYNFERYSELRDIITRKVENDIPNLIVIDGGKEWMYYTKISSDEETVASNTTDMLADAVDFANKISSKGDTINIYEAVQDLCELQLINRVLSWTDDGWSEA